MPYLPTLEKTYEHAVNQLVGTPGDQDQTNDDIIFAIKDALVSWSVGAATVWGSSNLTSWGNTGQDYWTTVADVITGSPGSWIVLSLYGGGQLLIARGDLSTDWYLEYSPSSAYTGGGLSTLPTASDEYTFASSASCFGGIGAGTHRLHHIHSTDGDNEWIWICTDGAVAGYLLMSRLQNAVTGWETQHIVNYEINSNYMTLSHLGPVGDQDWRFRYSGSWYAGGLMTAFRYNTPLPNYTGYGLNEWTDRAPLFRASFGSSGTCFGWHGRVADLFFAHNDYATCDTFEEDALNPTYEWAVYGCLVFPWNGTVPLATG